LGQVLAGRYRVDRLLGSGGMGSVYRAEHVHMRKAVAIKVLHREMTAYPEIVARFEREAVAAGRIEHPNVATATDFGKLEDGSFYLILEYVEGRSLGRLIDAEGPLPAGRALTIARQIADGLSAAHAAGIVHRDLKPDNVMLIEREGFADWVKVLDFGIAKVHIDEPEEERSQPLTRMGTVFGTPQYMSPEQGQGHTVDARADLYTLGVILYEMLAGKLPFHADDMIVLITRHITEPAPELDSSIHARVREIVADLLKKQPGERVQSAADLVTRIDAVLGDPQVFPPGSLPPGPPAPASSARLTFDVIRAATVPGVLRAAELGRSFGRSLGQRVMAALPILKRPVALVGRELPLGLLVLAGLILVVSGALVTVLVAGDDAKPAASSGASPGSTAPAAEKEAKDEAEERAASVRERAMTGDKAALAELDALKQKSAEDLQALGRGRCVVGEFSACVAAYRSAILSSPRLKQDETLLSDIRRTAVESLAYEEAMRLSAHHLGELGLDILYDVYVSTRGQKELVRITNRAKQFLDDSSVKEHASPALSALFDVERALRGRNCNTARKAVLRVIESGDERVVPALRQFNERRGCGLLRLGDCWECLRTSSDELKQAQTAAAGRKAPTFLPAD
jgi:serine/threonine-protein kinase